MKPDEQHQLLPEEAKRYFDVLLERALSQSSVKLQKEQEEFQRNETSNGRELFGEGHAARLSKIYIENLSDRAKIIVDTTKKVHAGFHNPLHDGVDEQLVKWALDVLTNSCRSLQSAFNSHLQHFGDQNRPISQFDLRKAATQTWLDNSIRHDLWELRNVPSKNPKPNIEMNSMQMTYNFHGNNATVVNATNSTVNIQQQWTADSSNEMKLAVKALKDALKNSIEEGGSDLADASSRLDDVDQELTHQVPNQSRIASLLSAVGGTVSTIASIQPAYEYVKEVAKQLGLNI